MHLIAHFLLAMLAAHLSQVDKLPLEDVAASGRTGELLRSVHWWCMERCHRNPCRPDVPQRAVTRGRKLVGRGLARVRKQDLLSDGMRGLTTDGARGRSDGMDVC